MLERTTPTFEPSPAWLRPLEWSRHSLLWLSLPSLLVVLAGAILFSQAGNNSLLAGLDGHWHRWAVGLRTPWLNESNWVLDLVGNEGMIMYCLMLFLFLLWRRHWRLALFTAAANLGGVVATHLLKFLVSRPRPENRIVDVDFGSYPSGHSSGTVAAMIVTAVLLSRAWIWICGSILSITMMFSRIYVGAHWVTDTLAGALLGIGLTLLLWALLRDKCLQRNIPAG
ncbi:phosphatase PAP2 family protein [Specibacter sp. NPDC057265]|uniref:phosphatase PAP2 family protein n=1 Tax=Specibacter sp. NPDC057265 TaxID=3346075 RepID=UPI003632D4F7